jgi:hypothetical protein
MISIGHIAKTYGILPSKVAAEANTFDIMITDVYSTWERHQMDKSAGRGPNLNDYSQEQLLEIVKRGRNGG